MKNINKYKTPQDKLIAWAIWRKDCDGCSICPIVDRCDDLTKPICFNAWLHSTTGQRVVNEKSMRKIKEESQ